MSFISLTERLAAGKALRDKIPRAAHGAWVASADRSDPVDLLDRCNEGRVPELIPLRYGRMLRTPFTFLRGSPALMAKDLATAPVTGIRVQACGDCHLSNFGLFATPERNVIFDINDFDETLHAPWEWDLKRLATSFVVASRTNGLSDRRAKEAATTCGRSYRMHMHEFAEMSPLEIWYYRISVDDLIDLAPNAKSQRQREKMAAKARARIGEKVFPKITIETDGRHHFVEQPPVVTRITEERLLNPVRQWMEQYRASLPEDRRFLFDRYQLEDFAVRVVGIGSVATRCYVGLLFCDDKNPLLLQVKEARRSALEPFVEKSPFANQGQRVVVGQRLMQAASDIFLGWVRAGSGHDYFVRQLRDMKFSIPVDDLAAGQLQQYAEVCGWTLARAHAKSGDPALISGYLGESDKYEASLAEFALVYADQIERDHAVFAAAAEAGRIEAVVEADR